jgi:hypothetical protein
MSNFWGHLSTITRHRHKVMTHCFKAGIFWQGCLHDLSKYSPAEFIPGVKYFQGTRSPNEGERDAYGYSKAWMHHKGRNKHHFEYWTDYTPNSKKLTGVKMPMNYVIEMFCDRVAASKIYGGKNYTDNAPLDYFLKRKKDRIIHPETEALIEKLLRMLSEKGEEETFKYIRSLKGKDY